MIDGENCSRLCPEQSMRNIHLLCDLWSPWKKWIINDTAHGRSAIPSDIESMDEPLQYGVVHVVAHMIENDIVDF